MNAAVGILVRGGRACLVDEAAAVRATGAPLYLLHDPPAPGEEAPTLDGATPLALPGRDLASDLLASLRALLAAHPAALIVPGDAPHLDAAQVRAALDALDAADVVLGPSVDGGTFLVGLRRPHDLFTGVAMGTSVALTQTVARARSLGLRVTVLDPRRDLHGRDGEWPAHPIARRLHLEITNRCPSRCATCWRTFAPPPARDLQPDEIDRLLDQTPEVRSVALQVNGEPLLAPALPEILRRLERRGVATELNTSGLLLDGPLAATLADGPLAALNVSLDAATPATYRALRGADTFDAVVENVRRFLARRRGRGPRVALWMVATRRNLAELPALISLAADLGADEVFLQRLVIHGRGVATDEQSLHGRVGPDERAIFDEADRRAREHGVALGASGGVAPAEMLATLAPRPRPVCRRPWESAAVLADGEVVPCCIATFLPEEDVRMGNALRDGWEAVFHGPRYQDFRHALAADAPTSPCRHCGVRWSV